jgi:hypothetical protein
VLAIHPSDVSLKKLSHVLIMVELKSNLTKFTPVKQVQNNRTKRARFHRDDPIPTLLSSQVLVRVRVTERERERERGALPSATSPLTITTTTTTSVPCVFSFLYATNPHYIFFSLHPPSQSSTIEPIFLFLWFSLRFLDFGCFFLGGSVRLDFISSEFAFCFALAPSRLSVFTLASAAGRQCRERNG